jgi:ubiquinone/menaquinone biosynthesis C-methylase UbiE
MDAALQRRVQRYGWDKAAVYYQVAWQNQLKPAHDQLFTKLAIQPGEKILDVACGTGLASFRAMEATGEKGSVLGTDISERMIVICNETQRENNHKNILFERMDAEELKVSDEEFDVVICAFGLMYVPVPYKALTEMYRTLKPGGRCGIAVWGKKSACGWANIFEIIDQQVASEVCPLFFNLGNEGLLKKGMEMVGFSNIYVDRIATSLHFDSAEEACIAAFEGGPVALVYFRFPDEIKLKVQEEYLASIAPYKEGIGYNIPGEFVIGTGEKPTFF